MSAIATTHVGSLPRSQKLTELIFAREHNQLHDPQTLNNTIREHVSAIVKKQKDAGIQIVSDGESSKISYVTYVKDRYDGFSGDSPRNAPADLKMFPGFLERLAKSGGTPSYSRPRCTAPLAARNYDELGRDIANLKNAMRKHNVSRGFMNAPSPGVISLFLPNQHYPNRETYLVALGEMMRGEYERIAAAGLHLQIDCPDLALSRHMLFTDLDDSEFLKIAALHAEVLNDALAGIAEESVRVHVCWGNYEGPHIRDIAIDKLFPILMSVRARHILFEAANPRHAHEWRTFRERRREIPDDRVLVPGVIDTTTNFVEHPRLVAERLARFVEIVGAGRVIAGSDCGFGTFAGFGAVDPDIAYAKLNALSQGAQLLEQGDFR
ncbi:MAG: cobalamin-independent methionine synthase II family protein [Alphaproteobacteria bacterium]|nr:cobalamin-independent methionine synthase II family protein [Alphaproteobacteria bacterium]MDA8004870.1 cobalamin-independent methionine synthase II family protein [Alphaproteobacteria bacterium]MDA8006145.1 cobalamin-independent methionine synthase II family protein [Alphaproteobacteria bacterium]MDA8013494.1 cobalamin-independent methionine synthase II family protein [Alphaproteobacteria bacterium]